MFVKTMLEGTEAVIRSQPKAIENFVVCDLPGFADFADQLPAERRVVGKEGTRWYGGMSYEQSLAAVRSGDLTGVAASDKLLGELEALVPVSKSWRTFNSVIGMCPNVPQYLAGNPYNMRLKRRCATATAPLSIFVELVASAGIDAKTCLKRGAAMLALVRMLANLRPVELWCVIAIGQRNSRSSLCVRLRHRPLGTWRAARTCSRIQVFFAHSVTSRWIMSSMRTAGTATGPSATMPCMSARRPRATAACCNPARTCSLFRRFTSRTCI